MTNKDCVAIGNRILASLPGYTAQKNLVFANPIGHTLKGVCFDRSAFDARSFYVQVFIQPMFVPAKHLGFNLGWRVGGGSHRWNADDPNMISDLTDALEREGVPFLFRVRSPREVAAAAASLNKTNDPYVQEAIAYALALAGDSEEAVAAFEHLAALLDVQIPWQLEMEQRARRLKADLLNNLRVAQRQLDDWRMETAKNLGLARFL
jgi:hypothetical protein